MKDTSEKTLVDPAVEWGPFMPPEGVRLGRNGSQRWVEWQGIGRLVASGAETKFWPAQDADPVRLQKFRATSLIACERYLLGRLSLHGSAVSMANGAVVLVGETGAGKSTTAMALVERTGGAFLADDIVPVDWHDGVPFVSPVEDQFWLTAESASWFGVPASRGRKTAYPPRARAIAAERLSAIVHLTFDEEERSLSLERLTGQKKFEVLSRAQVCYSDFEDADTVRNLQARADLAMAVPVLRLRRVRSLGALTTIMETFEAIVRDGTTCAT
jgi:serine kinase of HPr protein (carbohydrate metabolism regulator)